MFKTGSKKIIGMTGFTVLETIIAIAVVSLAIAGATSAVRTGIIGSSSAKDQVQAFYLAQEAIEIIRNIRDGNILLNLSGTPTGWLKGITESGPCASNAICTVDASTYELSNDGCNGSVWNSCPYLRQNMDVNSNAYLLYGYDSSWTQSKYRREVQVEVVSATEIAVTVQISWQRGVTNKSFKTKTILTDWF